MLWLDCFHSYRVMPSDATYRSSNHSNLLFCCRDKTTGKQISRAQKQKKIKCCYYLTFLSITGLIWEIRPTFLQCGYIFGLWKYNQRSLYGINIVFRVSAMLDFIYSASIFRSTPRLSRSNLADLACGVRTYILFVLCPIWVKFAVYVWVDFVLHDAIQGHETLKVRNFSIFKVYLLRHLQWFLN